MKSLPLESFRRVVVIRTDHIGDLIMSTPFLKWLRASIPQAEITLVVPPYTRDVLRGATFINRILVCADDSTKLAAQLHAEHPDLVICLSPRTATYRLAAAIGAPYRVGYVYATRWLTRLLCCFWLTHRVILDIDGRLRRGEPVPHEVEQHRLLAEEMGLTTDDDKLSLPLDPADKSWAQTFLSSSFPADALDKHVSPSTPVDAAGKHVSPSNGRGQAPYTAVLHLHQNWLSSGWTVADLAAVAHHLLNALRQARDSSNPDAVGNSNSERPVGLVITGGPAEATLAALLRDELAKANAVDATKNGTSAASSGFGVATNSERVMGSHLEPVDLSDGRIVFAGSLEFGRWASLIGSCVLTLSPDTGAVHVAAAVQCPVVVVFEAKTALLNIQQWAPWRAESASIIKAAVQETGPAIERAVVRLLNGSHGSV